MATEFNMSIRTFLKQVGVSSQAEIEKALRDAPAGEFKISVVLSSPDLNLHHEVTGTISPDDPDA